MREASAILETATQERLQKIMGMTGTLDDLLNAALDEIELSIPAPVPIQSRCECGEVSPPHQSPTDD